MHTSDTIDYGVVVGGEMTLELDDGKAWLPFLNTYRTMCLAPEPEFQRVLEEIRRCGSPPIPADQRFGRELINPWALMNTHASR
jgi:hypothetical protein